MVVYVDLEKLKPIKGLLFDKDGTLFDFHSEWHIPATEAAMFVAEGDEDLQTACCRHRDTTLKLVSLGQDL